MSKIIDLSVERQILGYCFLNEESLTEIIDRVKEKDFSEGIAGVYFREIRAIHKELGKCNLSILLSRHGSFLNNQINGRSRAETLDFISSCVRDVGAGGFLQSNIEILLEKSKSRQLYESIRTACSNTEKDNFDDKAVISFIKSSLHEIENESFKFEVADWHTSFAELEEELDKRLDGGDGENMLVTGIVSLDSMIGGMRKGNLILLAARPAVGKTTMAVNIFNHLVTKENVPSLFVALEQSRVDICEKIMCEYLKIDCEAASKNELSKEQRFGLKELKEKGFPGYFLDLYNIGIKELRLHALRAKDMLGIKFMVVDYLQLLKAESKGSSKYDSVSETSMALKSLARELDIPVICLSQLSRDVEKRDDPTPFLSDLRDSGSLEADADIVIFLNRFDTKDPNNRPGLVKVQIAKNRRGKTGSKMLQSVYGQSRFEEWNVDQS